MAEGDLREERDQQRAAAMSAALATALDGSLYGDIREGREQQRAAKVAAAASENVAWAGDLGYLTSPASRSFVFDIQFLPAGRAGRFDS